MFNKATNWTSSACALAVRKNTAGKGLEIVLMIFFGSIMRMNINIVSVLVFFEHRVRENVNVYSYIEEHKYDS